LFVCNNIKKSQPLLKTIFLDINIEKMDMETLAIDEYRLFFVRKKTHLINTQ